MSRTLVGALLLVLVPGVSGGQVTPAAKGSTESSGSRTPAVSITPKSKDGKDGSALPLTVDADKMERFGKASLVIFSGNVVARRDNSVQYADRLEVYMDEKGDRIMRTVSNGAVRIITKDCRTGTWMTYDDFGHKHSVVLRGHE